MKRHHQVYKSARYVRAQCIMCTTQACVDVVIGVLVVLCELHVIKRVHVNPLVHAVVGHSTNNWPNHCLAGVPDRSVLGPSSR